MGSNSPQTLRNKGAEGIPYFTPAQEPPAGTALSPSPPTLFTPITIRSVTFQNRIFVAPMCMYSAQDGHLTDFHLVHLSSFSFRGASLTIIEATAVQPRGRISPEDAGIWSDSHIAPIARIATFMHSQNQHLGIQLAHAGRKASTLAPWLSTTRGLAVTASPAAGGWPDDVYAPSPIVWGAGFAPPREMSLDDIKQCIDDFASAARRAVKAGVDVIEIHAAHGYLLCSFLSPLSNTRTDSYGGSFSNRIRILLEVITAVRAAIPESTPLFVRVSATEWMGEQGWGVEDTKRLARLLPALGVDLLDVSSGGNSEAQQIGMHNGDQVGIAGQIRELGIEGLKIGAVGMITEAEVAREIVQVATGECGEEGGVVEIEDERGAKAKADVVLVARQFLREPEWVLRVAQRLNVKVQWPHQYSRGTFPKGSRI